MPDAPSSSGLVGGVGVLGERAEFGLEHFLDDAHRSESGGSAAVRRAVDDGFDDLRAVESVAQGTADVSAQFVLGTQRDEHAQVEQAAAAAVQAGARPHGAPGVLGHELLHRLGVGATGTLERPLDEVVTHHFAPDLQTRRESRSVLGVGHVIAPC